MVFVANIHPSTHYLVIKHSKVFSSLDTTLAILVSHKVLDLHTKSLISKVLDQ